MDRRTLGMWMVAGAATVVLLSALLGGFHAGEDGAAERAARPAYRETPARTTPPAILVGRAEEGQTAASETAPAPAPLDPAADASDSAESSRERYEEDGEDDDAYLLDGAPLTASHPLVAPVIEVQNRRTRELMAHPLVVGVGTGLDEQGRIVLVVLAKSEIDDLPVAMDGVPLNIVVSGEFFSSKGRPSGKGGSKTTVDRTARFARPVPIGVSTGHPNITAGTIGCRVVDASGDVYALSNNHVFADENLAVEGDDIIQPGAFDGGSSPTDDLGTLFEFVDIDFEVGSTNTMDAAIVATTDLDLGDSTPSDGYGAPKSTTAEPALNLRVRKYGRTTGATTGRVFVINTTVDVGYSTGVARFIGQVVITPGSFSAGGDSGSLIVGQKGASARKPVALLFAGSSTHTIGTPIDVVLDEFSVTVDGE